MLQGLSRYWISTFETLTRNTGSSTAREKVDPKYPAEAGFIQSVSQLQGITAGGDFLGLCDQKSSYNRVSDFGRLRSYDGLKLRIEGNDY